MDWPHLVPPRAGTFLILGGGVAFAATFVTLRAFRKPLSANERERRRREYVDRIGRIASGTIIDILSAIPAPAASGSPAHGLLSQAESAAVVIYRYEVRGVEYEASQDLSPLAPAVDALRFIPGMTTSIKYDPADPGNSILASDRWQGIP